MTVDNPVIFAFGVLLHEIDTATPEQLAERHVLTIRTITNAGCAAVIARLLQHTWAQVDYDYDRLTEAERAIMPREVFDKLSTWAKAAALSEGPP